MVEIEIDGKKIRVSPGAMIIEAADQAGIRIPRFCYHKKLSIAANCRMCLVEMDKGRKPIPACATPVTDGMVVMTRSPGAIAAQRAVMEFLLINHPLDCPICDQGGECELQDNALGYGESVSQYTEGKRVVDDKNLGPLVATDMTRCIHCTRCVRFGTEIAGVRELGAVGRGEHTEITTYVEKSMTSELSGNVIDVCPVGALTSKPFRFSARAWELRQSSSIAPHDCVGSHINLHSVGRNVKRVVPDECEAINEVWISDRDRFSYEGLGSEQRVTEPLIKQGDTWQTVEWDKALAFAAEGLKRVQEARGNSQVGALVSPSATIEEMYLLQRLLRAMGSDNIDHRLRHTDTQDQQYWPMQPQFDVPFAEIEQQQTVLLVGSHVRKEQPIVAHRINKAAKNGAAIMAVNPVDCDFVFPLTEKAIVPVDTMVTTLAGIAKALAGNGRNSAMPSELASLLQKIKPTAADEAIAAQLSRAESGVILLGAWALQHPDAACLRALTQCIARLSRVSWSLLTEGANSSGAWLSGCVPHRTAGGNSVSTPGLTAANMIQEALPAYVLLGVEPEHDCAHAGQALAAVSEAEFVVSMTPFMSDTMQRYADVILPITPFAEMGGTLVNAEGRWQTFNAGVLPAGNSRPAWKVCRVLANQLALPGFDYLDRDAVMQELRAAIDAAPAQDSTADVWYCPDTLVAPGKYSLQRVTEVPMYAIDGLVRRASSLQQTPEASVDAAVHINATVAERHQLFPGDTVKVMQQGFDRRLPVLIDHRLPGNNVLIRAGVGLGAPFGPLELQKV